MPEAPEEVPGSLHTANHLAPRKPSGRAHQITGSGHVEEEGEIKVRLMARQRKDK